ncbi:MAG: type II toxin-antitoxin system RelE/ParE family toxin [Bacteroidia bacterium]|nr:type II toxin-antitoxin system RelE/ParE family toxin [Bacteroidia bacterium]
MEITVLFTDLAIEQLKSVFDYYCFHAGNNTATKITGKIVDKTLLLENHPRLGTKEILLKKRGYEIRFLIEGNYKILYWIEEPFVYIAAVFDCRQNPDKIKNIKIG